MLRVPRVRAGAAREFRRAAGVRDGDATWTQGVAAGTAWCQAQWSTGWSTGSSTRSLVGSRRGCRGTWFRFVVGDVEITLGTLVLAARSLVENASGSHGFRCLH